MNDIFFYLIAMYLCICALIGISGSNRQIGFVFSFLISILTTPIVGLIVTALSSKKILKVQNSTIHERASLSEELVKLNELREKGILTQNEFDLQKNKILNS